MKDQKTDTQLYSGCWSPYILALFFLKVSGGHLIEQSCHLHTSWYIHISPVASVNFAFDAASLNHFLTPVHFFIAC